MKIFLMKQYKRQQDPFAKEIRENLRNGPNNSLLPGGA